MRTTVLISAVLATLQLLTASAVASGGWSWPVRGPVITRYLNGEDPYARGQHRGVDIEAPVGAAVVAAAGGTVRFSGVAGSSGLTVSERTADGRYDLSYLHLSASSVSAGDTVAEGAPLGAVGTSGTRSAESPHLHFGVRDAGSRSGYRDPMDFLSPPPAGESPRPVAVPVPVAVAAAPARHPVRAAPSPLPSALALGGVPAGAPAHTPVAGAHPMPHALQAAGPAGVGRHGHLGPQQAERRGPVHADPRRVERPLSLGRGPAGANLPARGQAPPARAPGTAHSHGGGVDLGWLAACLGLVAAATLLAHPDQARRVARRGRSGFVALLRPSTGGGRARQ